MDGSRYAYNQAIKYTKVGIPRKPNGKIVDLRQIIKNNMPIKMKIVCKKYGVPKASIDETITKALTAYFTNTSSSKRFRMRFAKNISSIPISYYSISKTRNAIGYQKLKVIDSEESIRGINKCCNLVKKDGKYFLAVPIDKSTKTTISNKIISLDPGLRTFLTGYQNDGNYFEIGTNVYKEL